MPKDKMKKNFKYLYCSRSFVKNKPNQKMILEELLSHIEKGFFPYRKALKIVKTEGGYLMFARLEKTGKKLARELWKA